MRNALHQYYTNTLLYVSAFAKIRFCFYLLPNIEEKNLFIPHSFTVYSKLRGQNSLNGVGAGKDNRFSLANPHDRKNSEIIQLKHWGTI